MTKKCCACSKVELGELWDDIPFTEGQKISHAYCPQCYEELLVEIERFALQKLSRSAYTVAAVGQF